MYSNFKKTGDHMKNFLLLVAIGLVGYFAWPYLPPTVTTVVEEAIIDPIIGSARVWITQATYWLRDIDHLVIAIVGLPMIILGIYMVISNRNIGR
jgi:hypothetical protein